jgi:hypothetical protein
MAVSIDGAVISRKPFLWQRAASKRTALLEPSPKSQASQLQQLLSTQIWRVTRKTSKNVILKSQYLVFLGDRIASDVPAAYSYIRPSIGLAIVPAIGIALVLGYWLWRHRNVAYASAATGLLTYLAMVSSAYVDTTYRHGDHDDAFFGIMLAILGIFLGVILATLDRRISKKAIQTLRVKGAPGESDLKKLMRKIKADLDYSALVATVLGVPAIAIKIYPDKDLRADFPDAIYLAITHFSTLFLILGGLLTIYQAIMKRRLSKAELRFYGEL